MVKYKRYENAVIGQVATEEVAEPAYLEPQELAETSAPEDVMDDLPSPDGEEVAPVQEDRREKVSAPGAFGDDLDLPEFFR